MANRYIVKYKPVTLEYLQAIHSFLDPIEYIKLYNNYNNGLYVRLGGGTTTDISEANVIGWNKTDRWQSIYYELIPVEIVVK